MSTAYKCDRCGKYYDVDGLVRTGISVVYGPLVSSEYDLCKECMAELVKWLNERKEQNDGQKET